jgi:hypothetical protein
LAALIRRDAHPCHNPLDLALVADAHAHGVGGIIKDALCALDLWTLVQAEARNALDAERRRAALTDGYFRRQTIRAVAALQNAGIQVLTFKGEALACTHYSPSHLRSRCDSDLLVAKSDVFRAGRVLEALGYSRFTMVAREAVHTQQVFTERSGAMRHVIDLHWNVSHRAFFAGAFTFDELVRNSVEIGALPSGLRAPDPVHALLLACLHRVTHHENSTRLIWLYDIHLLADRLRVDQWEQAHRVAVEKSICDICATGIELATMFFGCSAQTSTQVAALRTLARSRQETSRVYLTARRGPLNRIALDARHAGNLTKTIRLLASHAFPDVEYMRRTFGVRDPLSLAGSYVYRAARGFRRMVM